MRSRFSGAKHYEVIVGNVGTVYSGKSKRVADAKFDGYVAASNSGAGRAGDEDVTMMCNDEPCREHQGAVSILEGLREEGLVGRSAYAAAENTRLNPVVLKRIRDLIAQGLKS